MIIPSRWLRSKLVHQIQRKGGERGIGNATVLEIGHDLFEITRIVSCGIGRIVAS
jgi:hypothetical protein